MNDEKSRQTDFVINCVDMPVKKIDSVFRETMRRFGTGRLQIGSYLCGNYFRNLCALPLDGLIENREYDMVIPVLSEKDLALLNNGRVLRLMEGAKHIVVNDIGLLSLLRNRHNLRLGRLFLREYRDHRYPVYEQRETAQRKLPMLKETLYLWGLSFSSAEWDWTGAPQSLAPSALCYMHYPYRLISCTRICEFASIGKPIEDKFIPDGTCHMQCHTVRIENPDDAFHNVYFSLGKGLYDRVSEPLHRLQKTWSIIFTPEWFV